MEWYPREPIKTCWQFANTLLGSFRRRSLGEGAVVFEEPPDDPSQVTGDDDHDAAVVLALATMFAIQAMEVLMLAIDPYRSHIVTQVGSLKVSHPSNGSLLLSTA